MPVINDTLITYVAKCKKKFRTIFYRVFLKRDAKVVEVAFCASVNSESIKELTGEIICFRT